MIGFCVIFFYLNKVIFSEISYSLGDSEECTPTLLTCVCFISFLMMQKIIMQFLGRRKKVTLNQQHELYGHCLQFYCQPPLENISLTEFEGFAVDRLKCAISHTDSVF